MRLDYIKNKNGLPIDETNFFDYLMVDINCIKHIFLVDKIEDYINIDNIEIYDSNNESYFIKLKNIELKSIHDVNIEISENVELKDNINENFIKKYIRRHDRLINLLKSDKNLCFIYQTYISKEDYIELNEIFKKYTNKNIIIISFQDYGSEKEVIEKYNNLYYLNYHNMYHTKDYVYEASMNFLNWDLIFDNINSIYNENFLH
jgi:adenosine deaminase